MTTALPNGELQSNPKIAYNKGYEKGRADEQIQSIEDAKMQATEYLNALNKAKEEAYLQGAREFAELLKKKFNEFIDYDDNGEQVFESNPDLVWIAIDEVLADLQKGEENEYEL